ncbi:hypothetical protein M8994_06875 [Brucella sp. 21LCYQ03]|nr:hypothetical protein [Brucella sp. 21LCYQ03]
MPRYGAKPWLYWVLTGTIAEYLPFARLNGMECDHERRRREPLSTQARSDQIQRAESGQGEELSNAGEEAGASAQQQPRQIFIIRITDVLVAFIWFGRKEREGIAGWQRSGRQAWPRCSLCPRPNPVGRLASQCGWRAPRRR